MKASRFINKWTIVSLLLAAVIIAGGLSIWSRSGRSQAIEITLSPETELTGNIRVDGEVSNPGIYPLDEECSIEDVVRMAGGVTGNADINSLLLHVATQNEGPSRQRIDINRAEGWLLEALPGIGETRAQTIIEYRQQNGFFRNTIEITKVEGIGEALYEEIKYLITVAD
jgi:competence protein ComEA